MAKIMVENNGVWHIVVDTPNKLVSAFVAKVERGIFLIVIGTPLKTNFPIGLRTMGQSIVGIPKRTISFYIHQTPSLNMLLKLNDRFILKVWFYSYIDTSLNYNSMHKMSKLNKFKDSYQVLEKNLGFCLMKK